MAEDIRTLPMLTQKDVRIFEKKLSFFTRRISCPELQNLTIEVILMEDTNGIFHLVLSPLSSFKRGTPLCVIYPSNLFLFSLFFNPS